ncbi:hypothetical protein [Stappia indica]|uniref:hypothetical protein n=1 Tax=Stappia indica TaxID=538381 RepID=UPI00114698FC|nr:hypothetical protein [Stappia indica]
MSEFWLGLVGVAVGATIQFGLDQLRRHLENKQQKGIDERRKALLRTALENPPLGKEWRSIQTLSRIVGANYETTTRLLIELGARGSEGENDVWALASRKPLGSQNK